MNYQHKILRVVYWYSFRDHWAARGTGRQGEGRQAGRGRGGRQAGKKAGRRAGRRRMQESKQENL